ncbi:hypothetical protein BJY04DRAFT_231620 [Aspergillus karnatakaensis]|uniref:Hsp70 family protein n=1 Tax=Aspergillus karnatakaensis TaxID=1810916 RepID=UPI003CCCAF1A
MDDNTRHRIIVGVDYGTTYTGKSIDDIILIKSWPGLARYSETVLKTPSRVAYPEDKGAKPRWGYQVEPGMLSYSWTKLLLDRGTPLSRYDAALESTAAMGVFRLPDDKDAVEVAGDFLAGVYEHIMATIAKQVTEEILQVTPLEFWFTVPAIWSDEAKHNTLVAAQRAGFGSRKGNIMDKICLITEPEAAAIAALSRSMRDGLGSSVQPGDGVLVCDCGGGTVDITTYLVKGVHPTLEFEELCTGTGGKCGSTAIDRKFYDLMRQELGKSFDDLPRRKVAPGSEFMNKFELVKRDFGYPTEQMTYELPLNITPQKVDPKYFNEDERLVIISKNDLRLLFDPIIQKILSLVRQQIMDANQQAGRDAINRVILVGGFGDSEYLRNVFREAFDPSGKITVTVPNNAQAAIVQGAALRGLQGLHANIRRCRRHYCVRVSHLFREGIDDESTAVFDLWDGKKRASGYAQWLVVKEQKLSENHTYEKGVWMTLKHDSSWKATDTLFSCDTDVAPSRTDHPGSSCVDVRAVGELVVDFRKVSRSIFATKHIAGQKVYRIDYCHRVVFNAEEGLLRFEAVVDGKVVGKTSIEFTHENFY